jgi:rhodanese-related sulfurtransferase
MYQDLAPKEFLQAFESTEDKLLVDVRTPMEIEDASIDGHIAINFQDASFPSKILELDKDKTIFVYCRSGNRSGQACRYLASKGYDKLVNLKGGMLAWAETEF